MTSQPKKEFWFIFQNDLLLVLENHHELLLTAETASVFKQDLIREYPLAELKHHSVYCAELRTDFNLPTHIAPIPLRKALDLLGADWYTTAAKAFSIINWDRNHHFCGRCGSLTIRSSTLYERQCTNCQLSFYPRISPSIIVLIKNKDHVLMARSPHFPPGAYALIAGFVEAGESIEDAVHREVNEEVGLTIKNLRYVESQSWPFPDSLMVGFTADYAGGDLTVNHAELEDAGWYRYDNLPGRPSSNISIGSKLLDAYIAEQAQTAVK